MIFGPWYLYLGTQPARIFVENSSLEKVCEPHSCLATCQLLSLTMIAHEITFPPIEPCGSLSRKALRICSGPSGAGPLLTGLCLRVYSPCTHTFEDRELTTSGEGRVRTGCWPVSSALTQVRLHILTLSHASDLILPSGAPPWKEVLVLAWVL